MSRKVIYMGHSDLKRCHVSWLGGMRGFKRIISVVWSDNLWTLRHSPIPFPFGKCPRGSPMLTVDYNWDEKQAAGWIFCFHLFLINCKLPLSFGWSCSADPRDTGALPAWGGTVQNCERQLICLLSVLRQYRTTSSCLESAFQWSTVLLSHHESRQIYLPIWVCKHSWNEQAHTGKRSYGTAEKITSKQNP